MSWFINVGPKANICSLSFLFLANRGGVLLKMICCCYTSVSHRFHPQKPMLIGSINAYFIDPFYVINKDHFRWSVVIKWHKLAYPETTNMTQSNLLSLHLKWFGVFKKMALLVFFESLHIHSFTCMHSKTHRLNSAEQLKTGKRQVHCSLTFLFLAVLSKTWHGCLLLNPQGQLSYAWCEH